MATANEQIERIYPLVLLGILTTWISYVVKKNVNLMVYASFAPSISVLITSLIFGLAISDIVYNAFFINGDVIMQCLIASWSAGFYVVLSVGIGVMFRWTKMVKIDRKSKSKIKLNSQTTPIIEYLRVGGEELGMRCFLFPKLLNIYGLNQFFYVSALCGIFSALSNCIQMIKFTEHSKMPNRVLVILFSAISTFFQTFYLNWLAYFSSFSWFVCTTGHFALNQLNYILVGNIETNKPGKNFGDLWKINAQGLAGCIAGIVYIGIMYVFAGFSDN